MTVVLWSSTPAHPVRAMRRAGGELPIRSDLRARAIRLVHENGCALREDSDALVCWGRDDRRLARGPDGEAVYVPAE